MYTNQTSKYIEIDFSYGQKFLIVVNFIHNISIFL
jgi:hypothetical protein